MNRRLLKGLSLLMGLSALTGLSSCSFFTDPDSGVTIKTVETTTRGDGSVQVKIIYDNENKEPTVFVLPAATGIDEITSAKEKNGAITITFKTTDGKSESFTIPAVKSIDYIEPTYNEDGSITLTIVYTDGTKDKNQIALSKGDKGDPGEDGKDGKGIKSIETQGQPDGSMKLMITYTDDTTDDSIIVPRGTYILSVDYSTDDQGNTKVSFSFSDGTSQEFVLKRQSGWIAGEGAPKPAQGQPGDFYYDQDANAIYFYYEDKGWSLLLNLTTSTNTPYTVTFELNADEDGSATLLYDAPKSYRIKGGHTFYSDSLSVPMAERNGYTFEGWYTDKIVTPVMGAFTNLTSVWSDMTLYAHWISK